MGGTMMTAASEARWLMKLRKTMTVVTQRGEMFWIVDLMTTSSNPAFSTRPMPMVSTMIGPSGGKLM